MSVRTDNNITQLRRSSECNLRPPERTADLNQKNANFIVYATEDRVEAEPTFDAAIGDQERGANDIFSPRRRKPGALNGLSLLSRLLS